jgi:putative peptidoglycan binding protein
VIKFKQIIYPGDSGRDVVAVRRALRAMGHRRLSKHGHTAGGQWVNTVMEVQRAHDLRHDGIYGPATHKIVAPHFDAYARWLYRHTASRTHELVNPFKHSKEVQANRIDMGVDYHGVGEIVAWTHMKVIAWGGSGWPGGEYIHCQITHGRFQGLYYYCAESVIPVALPGKTLKPGDLLCYFGGGARPGLFPGIEMGWSSPVTNVTYYNHVHGYYNNVGSTEAGRAFARVLKECGAPVISDPGKGTLFPS